MSRSPRVRLKWETREDEDGRRYAILRWTEKGQRQSRALGFVTTAEAERLRGDHEAAIRLQVASPIDSTSAIKVADVLSYYLTALDRRPVTEGYKEGEFWRCELIADRIGHIHAETVTADTLARYLGDRRREESNRKGPPRRSSLKMEIDTIRRAFRIAIEGRVIPGPVPGRPTGRLPNDGRPQRRLTEEEVALLVRAGHADQDDGLGPRDRIDGLGWLIQVLAWSGRRPVAVLALEVEDLRRLLDDRLPRERQLVRWRRDKGGEGLGFGPTTEPSRSALAARAAEVGNGRLWRFTNAKALNRPLRRVADAAGVDDVQPYDLRRFGVTRIVESVGSRNLKSALRFTGHTTVATLLRYVFTDEDVADASASRIGWTGLRSLNIEDSGTAMVDE